MGHGTKFSDLNMKQSDLSIQSPPNIVTVRWRLSGVTDMHALLSVGCLLRRPDAGVPSRTSHHVVVVATQTVRRAR